MSTHNLQIKPIARFGIGNDFFFFFSSIAQVWCGLVWRDLVFLHKVGL